MVNETIDTMQNGWYRVMAARVQFECSGVGIAVVVAEWFFRGSGKLVGAHWVLDFGDAYNLAVGPVDAVWFWL